jgi:hypothetical protein
VIGSKQKFIQVRFYDGLYEIDAATVVDFHLDHSVLYKKHYWLWNEETQKEYKATRQEAFNYWYNAEAGDLMDLIWDMEYKDVHPHLVLVEEEQNIPSHYEQWEKIGNVQTVQVVGRKRTAQPVQDTGSH